MSSSQHNTAPMRTGPPDPYSLVWRPGSQPARLSPTDLLALPIWHDGRLAAALILGWERAPLAAMPSSPSDSALPTGSLKGGDAREAKGQDAEVGLELQPQELAALSRLGSLLAFGLLCDPTTARSLEEVARRFSCLPYASGLHDFVSTLLDAVPELIEIRFSVRVQPILLLTNGLGAGGPAVLFATRPNSAGQQPALVPPSQPPPQPSHSQPQALVQAGEAGTTGASASVPRLGSAMSLQVEAAPADGSLPGAEHAPGSRIRAVRINLHHTLVAEALKSAAKLSSSAATAAAAPAALQAGKGPAADSCGRPLSLPGANLPAGVASAVPFSAASSQYANGPSPDTTGLTLDPITAAPATSPGRGPPPPPGRSGVQPGTGPSLFASQSQNQVHQNVSATQYYSMVVPNVASHMLEEGAPCRDLLLCSNLSGGGGNGGGGGGGSVGSLVLCVEAPAGNAGTGSGGGVTGANTNPGGGGGGGGGNTARSSLLLNTASSLGGLGHTASGLSAPLTFLHSQRQWGMYLLCADPLPATVLNAMASELQQLLGMALGACREGALSLFGGGRCAVEMYTLQEQLLNQGTSVTCGASGGIAGAVAAAMTAEASPPHGTPPSAPGGSRPAGALAAAYAAHYGPQTSRILGGAVSAMAGRSFGPGTRPLNRSVFNVAAGSLLGPAGGEVAAGGGGGNSGPIRSAGTPRLNPAMIAKQPERMFHRGLTGSALQPGPSARGAGTGLPPAELLATTGAMGGGGHAEGDSAPMWALASSPEVLLEAPAAGPSPLELMVTSMRTGLSAALTHAMLDSTDEAKNAMAQELAAVRLFDVIGRGGQGVVFHGTLHGLETAVKVIVHRGKGEPLAHDGGDGGGGADDATGPPASAGGAAAAAAGGGADADGAAGNSAGDLSRIRKAKRGALELVVTGALSHPNIVQVLASFSDVIMVRCTYRHETTPRLRLVAKDDPILAGWAAPGPLNTVACLEYCDAGTLLDAAHAGAFRPPGGSALSGAVRPLLVPLYTSLLEVALALRYLHSRRLVHCDLKPANVLLRSSSRDPRGWTCKLSDFGCVRLMTDLPLSSAEEAQRGPAGPGLGLARKDLAAARDSGGGGKGSAAPSEKSTVLGFRVAQPLGTIAYMSPESFVRGHTLGTPVDIYAFGIMMYELLMCRAPYGGIDPQALPRQVLRQNLRPEFHPLAPPEYCHLAARCWSGQASRRPTASQLVCEIENLLAEAQAKESRKAPRALNSGSQQQQAAQASQQAPHATQQGAQQATTQAPAPQLDSSGRGAASAAAQAQALLSATPPGSRGAPPPPQLYPQGTQAPPPSQQRPTASYGRAAGGGGAGAAAAAAAAAGGGTAGIDGVAGALVLASPTVSRMATSAAAAAGLDATLEVLQVALPAQGSGAIPDLDPDLEVDHAESGAILG
ncbi:hypothetical protein HYH03_014691 [Edaphochlamys debaryana]|uniref:Protein kinase domain-containing protein n=1 Tax=Edaphochlamys debaryana TaxID=47281 RepID=A0A835XTI5_9CHLO|nr:hypothetical protein HYH03_014691 [Edaphochlamys debaryana]|eukprot:KAG2486635.1 hypothetical protein HYH03_014691 [Edaphochlamys debaryana]